jgi:hypothetical protein
MKLAFQAMVLRFFDFLEWTQVYFCFEMARKETSIGKRLTPNFKKNNNQVIPNGVDRKLIALGGDEAIFSRK